METGDKRSAGTKHVWLHGWENPPEAHRERFDQLRGQKLRTCRSGAIKEMFWDFQASQTVEKEKGFFHSRYQWVVRSCLARLKEMARSFKKHLEAVRKVIGVSQEGR